RGKTVGNFEAISSLSACPPGLVATKMSLPARENWNSLTDVAPSVLLSLTAKLLLGWSQSELSVGNEVSPQKLPAAFPCVQPSRIYRTIRFIFLVRVMSPRIRSSRVLTGSRVEDVQLLPRRSELLGSGNILRIASPAGLSLVEWILLPGEGLPRMGSTRL